MMKAYYCRPLQIDTSMCDASGKLSLSGAFALFQDVASEHAEALGIGFAAMAARNSFWLTVRTRVRFYERPAIMSNVQLATWPAAPDKTRCERSYRLSQEDKILLEGRTQWCIYDTEKRAVRPTAEAGFPDDICYMDELTLNTPYARFHHDFSEEECALIYTVPSGDIDVGRHMNNVAYLRALTNSFSVAELEALNVSEMEIMFCLPCFEGDRLQIMRRKTQFGYEFGVLRPDGRYAALALMRAEEK